MKNVTAILSLLHEPPGRGSAERIFRGQPVLAWTLRRLQQAARVDSICLLCWDDQHASSNAIGTECGAQVICKGARVEVPEIRSIAAARRWADGWRGGLLSTCHFDLGFHAPWHHELADRLECDAVLLVDPSAALVDPALVDGLVEHALANESLELIFSPAAPGLGAVLLRTALLNRLAAARAHPGRLMHYHPDQVSREPLAADSCVPTHASVARTLHRFTLDSDRQLQRFAAATEPLNGQLISTGAQELVERMQACSITDSLPREIVLELNTVRSTRPIDWPGERLGISRPDLSIDHAKRLIEQLSSADDVRLTIAGVGDPLLAENVFRIIELAAEGGLAVHVETDLHGVVPEQIAQLAASPADVVSIHLPALTAQTYAAVMGVDGYAAVLENIRRLVSERRQRNSALPIIVPIFTKCRANLAEMEPWYDQWLRALGSAVIRGPSDCAGQIPDVSAADMCPPGRKPCRRLESRMTILSDGSVVSCEQDVAGVQVMGSLANDSLREIWLSRFAALRQEHRAAGLEGRPLCARCGEWHRP